MRAAGVEIITDYSEVAVVGITEIVKHLPFSAAGHGSPRGRSGKAETGAGNPYGFSRFPSAPGQKTYNRAGFATSITSARNSGLGGPWRANLVRRRFAKALCIFPFEEKFFRNAGVSTEFIGHPLVGEVEATKDRRNFARNRDWIEPTDRDDFAGSRAGELNHHLPVLQEACAQISEKSPRNLWWPLRTHRTLNS